MSPEETGRSPPHEFRVSNLDVVTGVSALVGEAVAGVEGVPCRRVHHAGVECRVRVCPAQGQRFQLTYCFQNRVVL